MITVNLVGPCPIDVALLQSNTISHAGKIWLRPSNSAWKRAMIRLETVIMKSTHLLTFTTLSREEELHSRAKQQMIEITILTVIKHAATMNLPQGEDHSRSTKSARHVEAHLKLTRPLRVFTAEAKRLNYAESNNNIRKTNKVTTYTMGAKELPVVAISTKLTAVPAIADNKKDTSKTTRTTMVNRITTLRKKSTVTRSRLTVRDK